MSENLKTKLTTDLKAAQKTREELRVSVLRLLLSEIHNKEIQTKRAATDEDILQVLASQQKRHDDSIKQFREGGRQELAEKEERELEIIKGYLPEALSEEELRELIRKTIESESEKNFGKIMGKLMPSVRGRAAGDIVSRILKEELKIQ